MYTLQLLDPVRVVDLGPALEPTGALGEVLDRLGQCTQALLLGFGIPGAGVVLGGGAATDVHDMPIAYGPGSVTVRLPHTDTNSTSRDWVALAWTLPVLGASRSLLEGVQRHTHRLSVTVKHITDAIDGVTMDLQRLHQGTHPDLALHYVHPPVSSGWAKPTDHPSQYMHRGGFDLGYQPGSVHQLEGDLTQGEWTLALEAQVGVGALPHDVGDLAGLALTLAGVALDPTDDLQGLPHIPLVVARRGANLEGTGVVVHSLEAHCVSLFLCC